MLTYQFPAGTSQKQKMAEIGSLWADEKESIQNEAHFRAVESEDQSFFLRGVSSVFAVFFWRADGRPLLVLADKIQLVRR